MYVGIIRVSSHLDDLKKVLNRDQCQKSIQTNQRSKIFGSKQKAEVLLENEINS